MSDNAKPLDAAADSKSAGAAPALSEDFVEPSERYWQEQSNELIERYYNQIEAEFFAIINDYLEQSNVAAVQYGILIKKNAKWKSAMIIATGLLAAINVCAALDLVHNISVSQENPAQFTLPAILNAVAALYAGFLTVAGNLEGVYNSGEKAMVFRESRELLLNRHREYTSKWLYFVEAYGKSARACTNASKLHRQLIESDQDLRVKLKQLTDVPVRGRSDPVALGKPV